MSDGNRSKKRKTVRYQLWVTDEIDQRIAHYVRPTDDSWRTEFAGVLIQWFLERMASGDHKDWLDNYWRGGFRRWAERGAVVGGRITLPPPSPLNPKQDMEITADEHLKSRPGEAKRFDKKPLPKSR